MLNIQENIDLSPLNTLHLKSRASNYLVLAQIEQLDEIRSVLTQFPRFFVLGGGSNLIVPQKYQGLVIHNCLMGVESVERGSERIVTAMAGENWDKFVAYCTKNDAFGLENLSLIPGTVGASPIQNIGAYGVEVKDFIEDVLVYDLHKGKLLTFTNEECHFSYRHSVFKNNPRYIVVSVRFKLSNKPKLNLSYGDIAQKASALPTKPTPQDLRNIIINTRQSKLPDPQELGNVGSFFHNPILPREQVENLLIKHPGIPIFTTSNPEDIKISAGWLIDNLGLKGVRQGNVGVYPKQALVLVNYGGACQSELLQFATWIKAQVRDCYNVQLNIEPIILEE